MSRPGQADKLFVKQRFCGMVGGHKTLRRHDDIQLAAVEHAGGLGVRREKLKGHIRRLQVHRLQRILQHHVDHVIRGHNAEMALAGCRLIHRPAGNGGLNFHQHVADRLPQFFRQRRGPHLSAHLGEQIVLKVGA
ncbi:TPA: hypothetical protein ACP5A9_002504 [Klebsiella quasipneumoniae]